MSIKFVKCAMRINPAAILCVKIVWSHASKLLVSMTDTYKMAATTVLVLWLMRGYLSVQVRQCEIQPFHLLTMINNTSLNIVGFINTLNSFIGYLHRMNFSVNNLSRAFCVPPLYNIN